VAEDVIPAAGGATPLPDTTGSIEAETAKPVPRPSRADRARRSAYRLRFVLFYFLLALLAGGAIGALVVVLTRPEPKKPAPWSAFVPTGSTTARLFQIIDEVPKRYRSADGKQLVSASAAPPQQLISPDGESTALIPIDRMQLNEHGNITTVSADGAVQFTLTGNGDEGTINTGKPSQQRYYLLQREALEMSLYALKYVNEIQSVTVLLPPSIVVDGATQKRQDTALFLRRDDVENVLSRPLKDTLPSAVPSPATMTKADLSAVRKLGIPHTFTYTLIRAQDGTFVRVFEPPS
jgi:hypothetical protein